MSMLLEQIESDKKNKQGVKSPSPYWVKFLERDPKLKEMYKNVSKDVGIDPYLFYMHSNLEGMEKFYDVAQNPSSGKGRSLDEFNGVFSKKNGESLIPGEAYEEVNYYPSDFVGGMQGAALYNIEKKNEQTQYYSKKYTEYKYDKKGNVIEDKEGYPVLTKGYMRGSTESGIKLTPKFEYKKDIEFDNYQFTGLDSFGSQIDDLKKVLPEWFKEGTHYRKTGVTTPNEIGEEFPEVRFNNLYNTLVAQASMLKMYLNKYGNEQDAITHYISGIKENSTAYKEATRRINLSKKIKQYKVFD